MSGPGVRRRKEVLEVVEREKTAAKAVSTLRMELKDEKEDHEKVRALRLSLRFCVALRRVAERACR